MRYLIFFYAEEDRLSNHFLLDKIQIQKLKKQTVRLDATPKMSVCMSTDNQQWNNT